MIGYIWLFLIVVSIIVSIFTGNISKVTNAMLDNASFAVKLSISLIGVMAFWLGLVKIAEKSGLVSLISKIFLPVSRWLFPEIPKDNPAIGHIAMNFSANALGVTNADTPIGIKAMQELQKINDKKDTASNPMCMFLGMNTSGFQLIPASAIAVLVAAGNTNPTEIIFPTLVATCISFGSAIVVTKIFEKCGRRDG